MSIPARRTAGTGRPRLVTVGGLLFLIGLVFLIITVLPFFFGGENRPLWLNLGCLLVPFGFILAVAGAVRAGRADQREALRQLDQR